jgi:hypothetical protein
MITRPVRERSVEEVVEAAEAAVDATGFEELALLSLSSSDYTYVMELVNAISERFKGRKMTISLPSLRIESVSIDLMDKLREHYSGGSRWRPKRPPSACAASSTSTSPMTRSSRPRAKSTAVAGPPSSCTS